MHLRMRAHTCMQITPACTDMETTGQCQLPSSIASHLIFFQRGSLIEPRVHQLASESQESSCLHPFRAGIWGTFSVGAGYPNLGPPACTASTTLSCVPRPSSCCPSPHPPSQLEPETNWATAWLCHIGQVSCLLWASVRWRAVPVLGCYTGSGRGAGPRVL